MTENQLLSDIREIATSGSDPVNFKIEDSQIIYWAYQIRAKLIAQSIQKRKDISSIWIQTISCMELEQVDKSECCDLPTGCMILKTVKTIPRTIETNNENSIIRVSDMLGNSISRSSYLDIIYNKYNKITANKSNWYIKNDYIYIVNANFLSKINIDLLLENPSDISNYVNCNGSSCYDSESQFPCSLDMANEITNIILKTKIYPFLQLPQDTTNDSNDKPDQQPNTRGL